MSDNLVPTVEVKNEATGFKFRLVQGEQHTRWASYTEICYLNGYGAITGYYAGNKDEELVPLTATKLLEIISVGIQVDD